MQSNQILNTARYNDSNNDEWYTTYETVENEVNHYIKQFKNKIVLCNCDDPYESSFSKYFLKNFTKLKLKKLICTSYKYSKLTRDKSVYRNNQPNNSYVLEFSGIKSNDNEVIDDRIIEKALNKKGVIKHLKGDGDFSSPECINYLKEADIIVTNPPFSKFGQLFDLIIKYNKKFLLIGNQNALTYKNIFPYIKNNKVWIGYQFGEMKFKVPNDSAPRKTRFWIDDNGQKWRSLGNAMWLTNLDNKKRHEKLCLNCTYSKNKYKKYDNYNAINVTRVSEIPKDYLGIMGVPITYLKYHNKDQFEIIGEANHGSDNEYDIFKPVIDGKQLFKKILIRRV